MGEKKIFINNNLNIEDLMREYYLAEKVDKEIHEIIISVDNNMQNVYGLAANLTRDSKGNTCSYYSIFQACCISEDFNNVNDFGDAEYNNVEELETFESCTEVIFLKKRFLNIIETTFDNDVISNNLKSLGM